MSAIIKRPEIKSVDFCVDENIWGHRLYDEQLPHLTVLEFLGVLPFPANSTTFDFDTSLSEWVVQTIGP